MWRPITSTHRLLQEMGVVPGLLDLSRSDLFSTLTALCSPLLCFSSSSSSLQATLAASRQSSPSSSSSPQTTSTTAVRTVSVVTPKWLLSVTSKLRFMFFLWNNKIIEVTHYRLSGQCNIWIRVYSQQPSHGRLSNVHNQPVGAAEWGGRGAGTNVPEGEFHCTSEKTALPSITFNTL